MESRVDGSSLQNFGIGRALGLGFRAWFGNFVPVTLLAAVLYTPIIIWAATLPGPEALETQGANAVINTYISFIEHGAIALVGVSTLLAPLLTYRVVQWMNGRKVPIGESFKYGLRGILPAVMIAVIGSLLGLLPKGGGILGTIMQCILFVAAPAAVAEKLNPFAALGRSAKLTEGRRIGIFFLLFMIAIVIVIVLMGVVSPLEHADQMSEAQVMAKLKQSAYIIVAVVCVYQIFMSMVQAVSYSLLRTDKDGVSNEELANVFG